MCFIL
jgi:hypothetical protein